MRYREARVDSLTTQWLRNRGSAARPLCATDSVRERLSLSGSDLRSITDAAIETEPIVSAVIFVLPANGPTLELAAASGVAGPALAGLSEAIRNSSHPVARTVTEGYATFDVTPIAPGGPALRSHVPLIARREGNTTVLGVLAVAHERSLSESERNELHDLASAAAAAIAAGEGRA